MANKLTQSALKRLTGLQALPQPSIVSLRHPVVLMHGFGVGGSFRRNGHLHDEAMHLRSRGVRAYAPNVAPYDTVAARSEMWENRLTRILDETGDDALTLVAHSMGGLDARYLIRERGWHDVVGALVTVSTPHRGSSVAHLVLEQPEVVRRAIVDMADWLGAHILEDGSADAHATLEQLTPEYVQNVFNPAVPNHPDVQYWSFGCQAGKGTSVPIDPVFRYLNAYLFDREGPNDGIVSVRSARWGTYLRRSRPRPAGRHLVEPRRPLRRQPVLHRHLPPVGRRRVLERAPAAGRPSGSRKCPPTGLLSEGPVSRSRI
jgi:triacylglycerol lipase